MSTKIRDALTVFKLHVAALDFEDEDTLFLDRALATSSELLYDIRHLIDVEWAEARARTAHYPISILNKRPADITKEEVDDLLAFINKGKSV
jgi:hypothetical protein